MKPNDQIKHAAMIAAADPKVQDEGDGHISLKSYADMLKSATVCLPTLIKEQLEANHIQEWSEGMPKWEEKEERDGERSEGWKNEEIAQWAQNIKITKKARHISQAASDSKLVNKVSIPAREVRTLWDMIDNVLDQSKQVGKMTDKIISHINKQKDEMLEEEANM